MAALAQTSAGVRLTAQDKAVARLIVADAPSVPEQTAARELIHRVNDKPRYTFEQKGNKWYRVEGKTTEQLS